jgi:hypothetical protein
MAESKNLGTRGPNGPVKNNHDIPDDPALETSYGEHIPEPSLTNAKLDAFGHMAGGTNAHRKGIHIEESISAMRAPRGRGEN